jgi:ABC-type transport system involved in multi-copper enzyme maturation permease subunit
MNRYLFVRTWRSQRAKVAVVALALVVWSMLMPIVYEAFQPQIKLFLGSGGIPKEFMSFGGGDLFSLSGAIAVGFIHPIAVALVLVFGLGFAVACVAGERQRGTLEVILARPISRRSAYLTLLAATALFLAIAVGGQLVGTVVGAALAGASTELQPGRLFLLWANGLLVYGALGAVSLLASVSFDRLSPALSISLGFTLVSYFLEIIGSLWVDAKGLQPWSLFHYLDAKGALAGVLTTEDWLVPLGVILVAVATSLIVFPRRDLAAPS